MRYLYLSCLLLIGFCLPTYSNISLSDLFSDNMVIQREREVRIWGWGDAGSSVTVEIGNQLVKTKVGKTGSWSVSLKPLPVGGPYTLKVSEKKSEIIVNNILSGDVWLCSGQSNMEMKLTGANNPEEEIQKANYPEIRTFNVPRDISYKEEYLVQGNWSVCNPANAGSFSAVAYFFARKIYEETSVPIGIINSSWGGTTAESWTGLDAYNTLPSEFIKKYSDSGALKKAEAYFAQNEKNKITYDQAIANDAGLLERWFEESTNTSDWKSIKVPQSWNLNELARIDGVVWLRYNFELEKSVKDQQALVSLGGIGDDDIVWVNGVKVGETEGKFKNRNYFLPINLLKKGTNNITVRVTDKTNNGGLYGRKEDVFVRIGNERQELAGTWKYKISVTSKEYDYENVWRNSYPSLTYNRMLHPLIQFNIKGVVWYQGEQNTGKKTGAHYSTVLANLIKSWRQDWGYVFPFYIIQLPNFRKQDKTPSQSDWAELREAQASALSLPQTGLIVTTDLGEAGDIHPRNKKDVGERVALKALNEIYGKTDIIHSGPQVATIEFENNKVVMSFNETGTGLISSDNYGYLKGFAVAGEDKCFYWAQATIVGNEVIVSSDNVAKPIAVRYNWADNPDGTLFNKEGLPAIPFRSDRWE